MRRILSKSSERRGATTVEFAVVAPVIFFLFLGAIEMTRMNFIRHSAANAAYEGARTAIVPGATADDARTAAVNLLNMLKVGQGTTVTITESNDRVTASVSVPTHLNSWGLTRFCSGLSIQQSCTLSRENLQ
jgi:Flp pilus assembly protein TadG